MLPPIEVTHTPDAGRVQAVNACQVGFDHLAQADRAMFAEESPVAFRYNGFAYAVMMATPADLIDFAFGFSLTEGIVEDASGIADLELNQADDGLALDVRLAPESLRRYLRQRRVRMLRGHTSCGICGAEDLSDIHGSLPRVQTGPALDATTIRLALDRLRDFQPLSLCTAAAHAAACARTDGSIIAVREDIGRHNALDNRRGTARRISRTGWVLSHHQSLLVRNGSESCARPICDAGVRGGADSARNPNGGSGRPAALFAQQSPR